MKIRRGAVLLLTIGLTLVGCGGGDKPISDQSCHELAATLKDIQKRLAPDKDFNTQSQATKDAGQLNDPVDALGGCPDEPSLQ